MFLAHWAATGPRETVVSSVRSESGSAGSRSMTRHTRDTARSASRSFFNSSDDGVGEAVLLGAGDETTGVTEMLRWGSGPLQLARPTRLNVKTHSAKRPS